MRTPPNPDPPPSALPGDRAAAVASLCLLAVLLVGLANAPVALAVVAGFVLLAATPFLAVWVVVRVVIRFGETAPPLPGERETHVPRTGTTAKTDD